jgi:lipopolysaccharide biosynthesis glycosyltransferase
VYPKLDKILFLDDDVVVQKDLTPLWDVDLGGNVNGAVETCGSSFHRFDKYLNFSNSLISEIFDANACGWAYGMNVFDLKQWRKHDITGIYHTWQSKVCIASCSTILSYSLETVNCDATGLYICLKSDRYFARNKFVPELR